MSSPCGARFDVSTFARNEAAGLTVVGAQTAWQDHTDEADFVEEQMQRLRSRLGRRYERLMQHRAMTVGKRGPEWLLIEALRLRLHAPAQNDPRFRTKVTADSGASGPSIPVQLDPTQPY